MSFFTKFSISSSSSLLIYSRRRNLRASCSGLFLRRLQDSKSVVVGSSLCRDSSALRRSSPPLRVGFSRRFSTVMASASAKNVQSVHDFVVKDARGNDVDLSVYKGKTLLIVNVASQCGLTNSNYTELSQIYDKYKNKGLEILAFPCNQFGGQEPGSNDQIVEFACTRFKAEYPIFDKVDVNGEKAAPIYKFLKSSKGGLFGDGIKWNFAKFLVDKDGKVVDRYAPTTSPLSIEKDIKKLLGEA
ncbi:glutathione peroxidase 6 [Wolffia australiana]